MSVIRGMKVNFDFLGHINSNRGGISDEGVFVEGDHCIGPVGPGLVLSFFSHFSTSYNKFGMENWQ